MKKLFLGLLIVVPAYANAGFINTSVGTFDVSTIDTPFWESRELLWSQVWFGNRDLADEFAGLVGDTMGLPNFGFGPLFAWDGPVFDFFTANSTYCYCGRVTDVASRTDYQLTYATATKVTTSVPEPGTLTLFGAGLLGIFAMRRRRAG